ncbi:MAG TPA: AAA family ATPase [Pseudolabrys sp.]|nr:AAA family ATPase [Pseudolabrys sp.]
MNPLLVSNSELDAYAVRQSRKSNFILFRELQSTSTKEWLIQGWLGAGDASAFYGIPGCGKSALVQDMGMHIAARRAWHRRSVKGGAVLYIALERKKVVERRAIAFRERHAIKDIPFAIIGGVFDIRTPQAVQSIIEAAKQVEAETDEEIVLIVIDTISRALAGGDENSPKDMGAIVAATSKLQAETKAHILWVHHMPQNGAERLRGHGALLGAMDTTIHVEPGDIKRATVIKANDSEEGERVAFTMESVTIGPETSAPVVIAEDADKAKTVGKQRLAPRAKLALDALTEALLAHGQSLPRSLDLPADLRGVTIDQWKNEMLSRNVLDKSAANWRTDFRRVLDQLASKGLIGSKEEFVWKV